MHYYVMIFQHNGPDAYEIEASSNVLETLAEYLKRVDGSNSSVAIVGEFVDMETALSIREMIRAVVNKRQLIEAANYEWLEIEKLAALLRLHNKH